MLLYESLAGALDAIWREEGRSSKVILIEGLLRRLPADLLRPSVRLLLGNINPAWERREMNVGPVAVIEVLSDLTSQSAEAINSMLTGGIDLGTLGEILLQQKSQHAISHAPLDVKLVYDSLCRISTQIGQRSQYRKKAILRGILMDAAPVEAKYIIRAVLGNMHVGLGPSLMKSAIGGAFGVEAKRIEFAYARLPDLGMIAESAALGTIDDVLMAPPVPIRPTLIEKRDYLSDEILHMPGAAYAVKYGGLRVQVHKIRGEIFAYSSQLRDITPSFQQLVDDLFGLEGSLVMEGELLLTRDGAMLPKSDVVKYINRRLRSRRIDVIPSLVVMDLLFHDDLDITALGYFERQKHLSYLLDEIGWDEIHSGEVLLGRTRVWDDIGRIEDDLNKATASGFEGILVHERNASYIPGGRSSCYLIQCGRKSSIDAALKDA
jgi:DNA ligase-1